MSHPLLLFSLDGVRPDALEAADAPHLRRLRGEGAWTFRARSVMPTVSLPCHMSMLRGVPVERHGITTNHFQPLVRPVPSVIETAHEAGRRTGFFYNWEPLRDVAAPGSLNTGYFWGDNLSAEGDRRIAREAVDHLKEAPYDLLFLYFGWPDECAHRHGWMSAPYLEAIENADACLGEVLEAAGGLEKARVMALSDHGGHGRSHGTDCDEDMLIPWIVAGPGIRHGFEITDPVGICDTCTTAAHLLGLPLHPTWEGRVVSEVLEPG